jgi:hypothetical protein
MHACMPSLIVWHNVVIPCMLYMCMCHIARCKNYNMTKCMRFFTCAGLCCETWSTHIVHTDPHAHTHTHTPIHTHTHTHTHSCSSSTRTSVYFSIERSTFFLTCFVYSAVSKAAGAKPPGADGTAGGTPAGEGEDDLMDA